MLKNYLTIAGRTLWRHKGYTVINVTGLALGIACCVLILLYVQGEWGIDRFHANADRLYRLNKVVTPQTGGTERHAITSGQMGPTLVADYPEVEQTVRLLPWFDPVLMTRGETSIKVPNFVFADSNFFQVFDFKLLQGDPQTALDAPLSIVLSESTARAFFGGENPMGQVLTGLNGFDYRVTGIVEDNPASSHLQYDVLVSWATTVPGNGALDFGWLNNWLTQVNYTYVLLAPGADPAALEAKLPGFMQRHFAERADQYFLYLQPLTDIYLDSSNLLYVSNVRQGNRTYVYVFAVIAVFILLIACINFVNLSTARAAKRAREVGVRKVLGAHRRQVAWQFLGESLLLALLGLLLAVALVELMLPAFQALTGKTLVHGVWGNPVVLVGLAVVLLVVGVGAGAYPALLLSGFRPVRALKGTWTGGGGGVRPRQVLVTAQFAISIALLAGTAIVYQQMAYLQSKDLGFQKDQVVVLHLGATDIGDQFDAFKQTLLQHPNITHAAGTNSVPGQTMMSFGLNPEGKAQDETWTASSIRLDDFDLLETYGMEMAAGRYFSEQHPADTLHSIVINEALARSLGWPVEEAVGKRLDVPGEVNEGTVIGVIKDFHHESLHQAISPMFLYYAPRHGELSVRITGADVLGTLDFLRATWERFEDRYPFEYWFLDDSLADLYQSEQRLMQSLSLFAGLAILIACLGLFGLATYSAEQRTKEIGVRKVLGATVPQIALLLSKDFGRLVVLAFVIAAPIAYFAMNQWLADFAYRIEMSGWTFLIAGLAALGVALVTVSYQAVKAAFVDPVQSLRYE